MTVKMLLIERGKKGGGASYYVRKWRGTNGWQHKSIGRTKKSGGRITRSMAEKACREAETAINSGQIGIDNPRKMTLAQFVKWHEESEGLNKRAATLIEWRTAGKHAQDVLGADARLDRLTTADVGRVRKHLSDKGRSKATIRKTLVTLKAMLNNAVRRELIHRSPLSGERLGAPPKREKRIFSSTEVDAMVAATDSPWWKALISLAYTTGLRKGEMLNLRWSDIDEGAVRVEPRRAIRHRVSDELEVQVFEWEPKTRRSARTVPMPPETSAAILRLRMLSDGSPYVFLTCDRLRTLERRFGTGPIMSSRILPTMNGEFRVIQQAVADANWKTGTMHDLRKSFATRAAAAAVPMRELQAHMGHSSITTTAEYYTDVETSAADRLRRVFAA